MPEDEVSEGVHAAVAAFDELVGPLERRAGKRLNEPQRSLALEAFRDRPDAVRLLAREALARGRNPVALFVKMIGDGDHLVRGADVDKVLAWARKTAPRLDPEHREQILEGFHLDPQQQKAIRAQIARSLSEAQEAA